MQHLSKCMCIWPVKVKETTETEDHKEDEMLAAGSKAAPILPQKPLPCPMKA